MRQTNAHMTFQQKIANNIMFQDLSKIDSFPIVPTPPDVIQLGLTINEMFVNNVLSNMFLDNDGNVVVN
jgi:hypothetical protein